MKKYLLAMFLMLIVAISIFADDNGTLSKLTKAMEAIKIKDYSAAITYIDSAKQDLQESVAQQMGANIEFVTKVQVLKLKSALYAGKTIKMILTFYDVGGKDGALFIDESNMMITVRYRPEDVDTIASLDKFQTKCTVIGVFQPTGIYDVTLIANSITISN